MDIKNFIAGKRLKGADYLYFLPEKVNHSFDLSDSALISLIEEASIRLGELNSFARIVPDIDNFILSYATREAVSSSSIEGTKTNIKEAFTDSLDISPERRDDWHEVNQYVQAMSFALNELKNIPLSNRLIKATHKILLSNVRGKHKNPGEFRYSQNWIGGISINDAIFVPPSSEHVEELMSDLERFLHNKQISVPHLVRIAIAHYQFETIHPFLDGNGRIGRLLIILYLISNKILEKQLLYPSDYFERHKQLYFEKLTRVRENNDLLGWIKFFIMGIKETSEKAIQVLQDILRLKEKIINEKIVKLGRKSSTAQRLSIYLFRKPVVSAKEVQKELELSSPTTANNLIRDFIRLNILQEYGVFAFGAKKRRRNRWFVFADYLKLLRK